MGESSLGGDSEGVNSHINNSFTYTNELCRSRPIGVGQDEERGTHPLHSGSGTVTTTPKSRPGWTLPENHGPPYRPQTFPDPVSTQGRTLEPHSHRYISKYK